MTKALEATETRALVDSAPGNLPYAQLSTVQNELAKYKQEPLEPEHYFAPGMYGRKLFIPADTFVVGKIHRHEHIVMLMAGTARINTDNGLEVITGPHVWISPAGAKRALRTLTDCTFFTCHATDERDLDQLEADLIAPEPVPAVFAQKELP